MMVHNHVEVGEVAPGQCRVWVIKWEAMLGMTFLGYNGWLWWGHSAGRLFANWPCLNGVFISKDHSFKTHTDGSISITHIRNNVGVGKHVIVIWGMFWGVWLYNHECGLSQWHRVQSPAMTMFHGWLPPAISCPPVICCGQLSSCLTYIHPLLTRQLSST